MNASIPLDFSRLDQLMKYSNDRKYPGALSLIQSIRIFTRRHGGAYAAVLLNNEDHGDAAYEALAEDYGLTHHLSARPWFPYREGETLTEAIQALLDFINNELPTERDKIINWSVSCAELEYRLAIGGDGYFDIASDWKLTIEEAYNR